MTNPTTPAIERSRSRSRRRVPEPNPAAPALKILLSPADRGTAWRESLRPGESRLGFEHVGPLGFVQRLGRVLGLRCRIARPPERIAAYAQRLAQYDDASRSYSASRSVDPFGVATFLLGLRDQLVFDGWDGRFLDGPSRLGELCDLETMEVPLPPGLPDTLRATLEELETTPALAVSLDIHLTAPDAAYPVLMCRLLTALQQHGATVTRHRDSASPLASPSTDLGRVQQALTCRPAERIDLAGDGTFLVLEADTPLEAAELLASCWHHRSLSSTTMVVPMEAGVLDTALSRHGLSTLGLRSASRWRSALQILPLRLALAFSPRDPQRAAELLSLPHAPLTARVRRRLLGALGEMPGIGGPAWERAVAELVEEEGRVTQERQRPVGDTSVRERIDAWFGGEVYDPTDGIPAAHAAQIAGDVASWAQAHAAPADPANDLLAPAAAVARVLQRLLTALPPEQELPQLTLEQLHDSAVGYGLELAPFEGTSGRAAYATSPADLCVPADCVLWWGFVRDAASDDFEDPWTPSERAALAAHGVDIVAPGIRRHLESWGWRRPLLAARELAVLIRWGLSGADATLPHPLDDELRTILSEQALTACTLHANAALAGASLGGGPDALLAATVQIVPARPLAPRPVWRLPPATLESRGPWSASALEKLFGCPLAWVLSYAAGLAPGKAVSLPEGAQLLGNLAHGILQSLLTGPDALTLAGVTPDEAARRARTFFDARIEREAAPLVRRGSELDLDRARVLIADAAAALTGLLQAAGLSPLGSEVEMEGTFAGLPIHGRLDLLVRKGPQQGVIDLKLGGSKYRREELETGRALQLAIYAALVADGSPTLAPAAFFVLEDTELLGSTADFFGERTAVGGPSFAKTLEEAAAGLAYWRKVFAHGLVPRGAAEDEWREEVEAAAGPLPAAGPAVPTPQCKFCHFGTLCEVTVGTLDVEDDEEVAS